MDNQSFCCNDGSIEAAQSKAMMANTAMAKAAASTRAAASSFAVDNNFHDADSYERYQFFYHPNHLGSSSYITNLDGEVVQHIEYVPFGEVFIEERNSTWNTPYLFNAKEFDEETGLYYYGARYYDSRTSLWLGCDAEQENNPGFSTYCFVRNNPIIFFDPDGNSVWTKLGKAAIKIGAKVGKQGVKALNKTATYTSAVSDVTDNIETISSSNTSNGEKIVAGLKLASELLPISYGDLKDGVKIAQKVFGNGSKTNQLRQKAKIGQEAHRQIEAALKKGGAKTEVTVKLPNGKVVRKDAQLSDGTYVIIKPNTPSGHKSAQAHERLMKQYGHKTKTIYYDPNSPRYQPGSPTYIGPKK